MRNFTSQPVDKELIVKLVELATHAPSACNIQGWHFIVVDDEKIKNWLVDEGGSVVIKNAPAGILILYDNRTKNTEYQDHIQSAAAAIENLLLGATYHNLGACWICHLPPKNRVRQIFSIPKHMDPIAYLLLGHKEKISVDMPRKYQVEQMISHNRYNGRVNEKNNQPILWIKKILMKIYYLAPLAIKKGFLNKYIDKKFVKKFKN